ncbi:PD-(D/E)XK nuclease-like domain-containing protein [Rickettsiella massiliensis]|uniref:PD-(D/E)XK nuclease-like domain-containing protein n=1 Tax=Rickettsiella massiliensis TaxID=676517 RepID=UPI00029B436C|nr:PD-(D/E)XK nuclease-like domain-containing protein [Rickettsiella massiliensis]
MLPNISSPNGLLWEFKRSPYHYWYKYKNPDYIPESPTPAQILGYALHTTILEPEKFEEQLFVLPKVDKRTKAGAEKWKQLQETMGNRSLLTEAQYEELCAMKASFEKNTLAVQLIQNAEIEQSIYWKDLDTDILCKCRPDILHNGLVVDLKTAQDGSAWSFSKAVHDYGYHIQVAMIREALRVIKQIDIQSFWFIVIEKSSPYVVSTYKLDAAALEKGYEEFKHLLARYQYCLKENDWPAYETQEISLPRYAFN